MVRFRNKSVSEINRTNQIPNSRNTTKMSDNISPSELETQLISTLNMQVYQFRDKHLTRLIKKHYLPREHFLLLLEALQQTLMEISNNPLELNNFIFSGAIACLLVQQRNRELGFPQIQLSR